MPEKENVPNRDRKGTFVKNRQSRSHRSNQKQPQDEFEESVVEIRRVVKVVKGGKNLSFRAVVVVGNKKGKVGLGVASAREVISAIRKAVNLAKRNVIQLPIVNDTIPHEIMVKFNAAKVLLKPAVPGTGIISSTTVRPALELAGVKNVLCKSLGSSTPISVLRAIFKAFEEIKPPEYYAKLRDIDLGQLFHGSIERNEEQ